MLPKILDSSTSYKPWLYVFPLIIILCYTMFGFEHFFTPENIDVESEGSLLKQLVLGFAFLFAFVILLFERDQFINQLKGNWLLIFFLIYTLFSCLWSDIPLISFKRWIQFLGIILIAMAAMRQPSGVKYIYLLLLSCTAVAIFLSLMVILIHPSTPFITNDGAWSGLYKTKNELGGVCLLAITFWLPTLNQRFSKKMGKLSIVVLIISLLLLINSRSATAILSCLAIILIISITKVQLPITVKLLFILIPFICIQLFFANFMDQSPIEYLFSSMERDMTLTGRTELWANMFAFIKQHPLLGIGYNGFWAGEAGKSNIIVSDLSWTMNQAHNGYIDIINELGFLGLGIFILLLTQSIIRIYPFMRQDPTVGISFLMIIISLVIRNFAETSFCRISSLGWVIFLIILITTSQSADDNYNYSGFRNYSRIKLK